VNSEMAPLLVSPALRTLFGRLPRCAGDAAPPVVTDPGRLSPTRLLIRDSISRRLSARAGAGEINCVAGQRGRPWVRTVLWGRIPDIAAAKTWAAWSILSGAKLSLALQLCELGLLRENLVPTLLHCGCVAAVQQPISRNLGIINRKGVFREALYDCAYVVCLVGPLV
jgi:hypothetical protein